MLKSQVVTSNGSPIARSIPLESCREYKMTPPDYMNTLQTGQIFGGPRNPNMEVDILPSFQFFLESPPPPVTSVETTAQVSPDRRISLTSSIITSGSPDPVTKSIRIIQQHDPPHFSIMSYVVSCLNFVVKYIK